MQRYEYKVVPAPRRGTKSREAKTTEDRFALTLSTLMNDLGREGWEYQRAETLPCDERSGFTGTKTSEQIMLVFRRALADVASPAAQPALTAVPAMMAVTPRLGPALEPMSGPAPAIGKAE